MFKAGDKVRCTNSVGNNLITGREYVIESVGPQYYGDPLIKLYKTEGLHFSRRFELAEEETSKPTVFKIGSLYRIPNTGNYTYKCCGFTSTGVPLFENPDGSPALMDGAKLIEYVKPIEVGSKVRFGQSELTVTAIHGDYAWVHTQNALNVHGGPGGMIQRLDKLKVI